jgi:hypothetical protein
MRRRQLLDLPFKPGKLRRLMRRKGVRAKEEVETPLPA